MSSAAGPTRFPVYPGKGFCNHRHISGKILEVAETYCKSGARDKVGTILYAMGFTHHTVGVQNIRAFTMLQLLLGNIGLAGGGVNALRGESQRSGLDRSRPSCPSAVGVPSRADNCFDND